MYPEHRVALSFVKRALNTEELMRKYPNVSQLSQVNTYISIIQVSENTYISIIQVSENSNFPLQHHKNMPYHKYKHLYTFWKLCVHNKVYYTV